MGDKNKKPTLGDAATFIPDAIIDSIRGKLKKKTTTTTTTVPKSKDDDWLKNIDRQGRINIK